MKLLVVRARLAGACIGRPRPAVPEGRGGVQTIIKVLRQDVVCSTVGTVVSTKIDIVALQRAAS